MRVLLVHNFYREPGGEDYAFRAEAEVLREGGHEVETFVRSSTDETDSWVGVVRTAIHTPWSRRIVSALQSQLARFRPDVVHFHNTFPLISPSAYYVCRQARVPVVQTLHNYRLLCAKADFFRDGAPCENCLTSRSNFPAVRNRCYRDSVLASLTVAGMLGLHTRMKTWSTVVDRYVVLTEFSRSKFLAGGLPASRVVVKPNFLVDEPRTRVGAGEHALFIGRITREKGIFSLMEAWEELDIPLRIVGDGPASGALRAWAADRPNVRYLGHVRRDVVLELLRGARFLVFPSLWYEGFPIAILESMASGVPVLASRIGSLAEIVHEASGGITFPPGDAPALRATAKSLWENTERSSSLGEMALRTFRAEYAREAGYRRLVELYESATSTSTSLGLDRESLGAG